MSAAPGTTPLWRRVTEHETLHRAEHETPADFKRRIAERQLAVACEIGLYGVAVGRYTRMPDGSLDDDMAWGLAHERLPADTCVIGSYPLLREREP